MKKYLDSDGLSYLWNKVKIYVSEHAGSGGTADSISWDNITDKPDLALKGDLASVYRFKGTVADYSSLPIANNATGDVWNVETSGMNYAWTGEDWDALGESIEIESITDAEIDEITAEE